MEGIQLFLFLFLQDLGLLFLVFRVRTWWLICDYQYWTWSGSNSYEQMVNVPEYLWKYLRYSEVMRGNIIAWQQTFVLQTCFLGAFWIYRGFGNWSAIGLGILMAVGYFLVKQFYVARLAGVSVILMGYKWEGIYCKKLMAEATKDAV